MKQGSKSSGGKTSSGSSLVQSGGVRTPKSGQYARVEALRNARAIRVKEALSKAGSSSTLFKHK